MDLPRKFKVFIYSTMLLALGACSLDSGFTAYQSVAKTGLQDALIFDLKKVEDTLHPQNIFVYLRNDNSYPFANIFLICTLKAGEQLILKDTLEYAMAAPDGTWLGKGFTEVKESKLWWKEGIVLPKERPLTIEIQQAMRTNGNPEGVETLEGIVSVGISVEAQEFN